MNVSVNDLVIRSAALALRDVPEANAKWNRSTGTGSSLYVGSSLSFCERSFFVRTLQRIPHEVAQRHGMASACRIDQSGCHIVSILIHISLFP